MKFTGQIHIGIFVKDVEASARFYQDVLSFELLWRGENTDETGTAQIALVRNNDLCLELVQLPGENAPRPDGPVDHVAVKTDNVYEAFDYIRSLGFATDTEEIIDVPGLFGTGAKWFFFRGPDGERIEIAQG